MLANGVVIETEVLGEFGDVDWSIGIGEVAKDAVTGGVTQSTGLDLERSHWVSPPSEHRLVLTLYVVEYFLSRVEV